MFRVGRREGGVKQAGTDPPVFCLTGKQESLQGRRQQKQLTGDLLPETPVRWRTRRYLGLPGGA